MLVPLLAAFIYANFTFGKLTKQSLFNMQQAVETTRVSRVLTEELAVMERSARQYFVLQDTLLLTNYNNAHQRFSAAMNTLINLPMAKPLKPSLQAFYKQENALYLRINQSNNAFNFDQHITDEFNALSKLSNNIINKNNTLIDDEAKLFKQKVTRTQQLLFWQTLTLIPLAVVLAGIITWMIARPIRRMDDAIEALGQGNYEQPISINGPGDLRKLGLRLDWLRVALKDLHQQKQLFLQQASHELKTPLTAIREASELLNDGVAGELNVKQADIVKILRNNSLKLQTMIEKLLKYTELQFAQMPHAHLPTADQSDINTNLQVLINDIVEAYQLTINNKKMHLNMAIDAVELQKNSDQLRIILDNLISNAVKFTPENGEMRVLAKLVKGLLVVEVIDTGVGIDQTANIFDPFYRDNQSSNSLVAGSGLGLFIAKEATGLLKGELNVMPKAEPKQGGVGAHFILRVPQSSIRH